ncbi:hypothetical protein [Micromonospora sp. NBRC 101691]|uniref:hypothetical protein n=1 Tax=Micromonospora sp. NBRC 101691 TaxID=3032198 RepID=UPI0024A34837|nr:hypothetical protein [Micromonospora sp. NBRC 101691]GLY21878.1 hypothetical protein Misp04_16100 [Micromonospora sp. NBRC 101691]
MQDASERDTAGRDRVTMPRSRSAATRVFAYLVMIGWHVLVVIVYFVLLERQPRTRVNYGPSRQEDMGLLGIPGALVLVGTLLTGVTLLQELLAESRINSAIVLGTAAALPTLVFAAVAVGPYLR